jgi:hypothetical protein
MRPLRAFPTVHSCQHLAESVIHAFPVVGISIAVHEITVTVLHDVLQAKIERKKWN